MRHTYTGKCHCETLQWRFHTEIPTREWTVRSCQCSFCRAHGARCTTDPAGTVEFSTRNESVVLRYRFALSTAEFLVCKNCGVYIGAVMSDSANSFTTININTMTTAVDDLPDPIAVFYDDEDIKERVERRQLRWTPVSTPI